MIWLISSYIQWLTCENSDVQLYSLYLNGFVTAYPYAVPYGQPVADQKHSWCFCLKKLTSNIEQNHSNPSLLGYSRYMSNLLRQLFQTKSPGAILNMFLHGPKGGGQEARNKFHSFMQYPG